MFGRRNKFLKTVRVQNGSLSYWKQVMVGKMSDTFFVFSFMPSEKTVLSFLVQNLSRASLSALDQPSLWSMIVMVRFLRSAWACPGDLK